MKRIVLVTGGSRSGKSSHALELASRYGRKAFIATAEALDREMRARIDEHRRTRDASFHTVEEPTDLAAALKAVPLGVEVAVIDCITVWRGNLFYHQRVKCGTAPEIEAFTRQVSDDCARYDLCLMLEPLSYSLEDGGKLTSDEKRYVVTETARRLTRIPGVDILKAELPLGLDDPDEAKLASACSEVSAASDVPWILLSAAVSGLKQRGL